MYFEHIIGFFRDLAQWQISAQAHLIKCLGEKTVKPEFFYRIVATDKEAISIVFDCT